MLYCYYTSCAKVASLIKGQPLEKIKDILTKGTKNEGKQSESKQEEKKQESKKSEDQKQQYQKTEQIESPVAKNISTIVNNFNNINSSTTGS